MSFMFGQSQSQSQNGIKTPNVAQYILAHNQIYTWISSHAHKYVFGKAEKKKKNKIYVRRPPTIAYVQRVGPNAYISIWEPSRADRNVWVKGTQTQWPNCQPRSSKLANITAVNVHALMGILYQIIGKNPTKYANPSSVSVSVRQATDIDMCGRRALFFPGQGWALALALALGRTFRELCLELLNWI